MTLTDCHGVVLAGGYSRRFGEAEKALVRVGNETMLQRVVDRVGVATGQVTISCRRDQRGAFERLSFSPPVQFVTDPEDDCGPLFALHHVLKSVTKPFTAVVACDMPGVRPSVIHSLYERVGTADGAVPLLAAGIRQPLQAVYRTDPLRDACQHQLETQTHSVSGAVDRLEIVDCAPETLGIEHDSHVLANVNTRQELDRFETE